MSTSELTGIYHRARGKALKTTRNLDLASLDQTNRKHHKRGTMMWNVVSLLLLGGVAAGNAASGIASSWAETLGTNIMMTKKIPENT